MEAMDDIGWTLPVGVCHIQPRAGAPNVPRHVLGDASAADSAAVAAAATAAAASSSAAAAAVAATAAAAAAATAAAAFTTAAAVAAKAAATAATTNAAFAATATIDMQPIIRTCDFCGTTPARKHCDCCKKVRCCDTACQARHKTRPFRV